MYIQSLTHSFHIKMYKTYYYEDLFLPNTNLRHKILEEVIKYDAIEIKCLSSKERHLVYREIYLPLGFKKVEENEHVNIIVYNRLKKKKPDDKFESDNEYSGSELSDSHSDSDSESESESESESDDSSYVTEEMEKLDMLENMNAKQLQHLENIDKNVNYLRKVVNSTLFGVVSGSIYLIYLLQPPQVNYNRMCLQSP